MHALSLSLSLSISLSRAPAGGGAARSAHSRLDQISEEEGLALEHLAWKFTIPYLFFVLMLSPARTGVSSGQVSGVSHSPFELLLAECTLVSPAQVAPALMRP